MSDTIPDRTIPDGMDDIAEAMRAAVRSGEYPSAAAIMTEALETWRTNRVLDAIDPVWLKRMYDEGVASGIHGPLDMDEIIAELKAELPARKSA